MPFKMPKISVDHSNPHSNLSSKAAESLNARPNPLPFNKPIINVDPNNPHKKPI